MRTRYLQTHHLDRSGKTDRKSHPKAKGSGPEYITNSELIIGKFDDSMHLAWAITMFRADSVVVVMNFL
jgi:hypothetical protein